MFYRRKIILALLQNFQGELEKIRLQKLLFLVSERQEEKVYDFIPYKFGCFSYSANADITTMVQKGFLSETESHFKRADNQDYLQSLKETDRKIIQEVSSIYGKLSANGLMKHTYINFPFWALNSVKAPQLLSESELQKVTASRNTDETTTLFTIGYEGVSPEAYLNKLIKNNVYVLVDVRKNALSMKYGFSKSHLKRFCESVGIEYVHIPEVGIESDKRQTLNTQQDYDSLFEDYKSNCLTNTIIVQQQIIKVLKVKRRIALTCFEANICQCHRKPLAESIASIANFDFELKHI
jgi:uncharacterized protein (DUF488 family)